MSGRRSLDCHERQPCREAHAAIGVGAGAAQRSAIAVTIIGGQTLCLLLTLIVTPVTYSLLSELGELRMARIFKALRLRPRFN